MYGARHCAPRPPCALATLAKPYDATHAMSSVPERRRHPRISVSWPVRLWVDDEALLGRAEDVSRHGLWVTVPPTTALKLGEDLLDRRPERGVRLVHRRGRGTPHRRPAGRTGNHAPGSDRRARQGVRLRGVFGPGS